MNLLQIKYALAVAETNSINKAADELFVGAPALSRAIKDLESDLGVMLFERSARGMFLTQDGEIFIRHAKKILKQVEEMEEVFKNGSTEKEHFSISVPRATYIASALASFSKKIDPAADMEIFYDETNTYHVIDNIISEDYRLGVIRHSELYDGYYSDILAEKGFVRELVTDFAYVLIMSKNNPMSQKEEIKLEDLDGSIEIVNADLYVSSIPIADEKKEKLPSHNGCRIYVFERASQFELLSKNPNAYMWVSSIPQDLLDRYDLVEKQCPENKLRYRDVLIYREGYKLSKLDKLFIEELMKAGEMVFKGDEL